MHLRREIKEALVRRLKLLRAGQYPTMAQDRVYKHRRFPLDDSNEQFPACTVFVLDEDVTKPGEVSWTQVRRTLRAMLVLYVRGLSADDDLDLFTRQVEAVFKGDDHLGDLAESMYLTRTEILYDDESEPSTAEAARMVYEITYITPDTASAEDDFNEADVTLLHNDHEITNVVEVNQ